MFANLFADAALFASRSGSSLGFFLLAVIVILIVAGRSRRR